MPAPRPSPDQDCILGCGRFPNRSDFVRPSAAGPVTHRADSGRLKIDELQLERPPGTSRKPPLELKLRKEQGELWASLRGEGVRAFPKCTLVQRSSETPFQEALGGGAGTGQSWGPAGSCGPASCPRLPLPPIPHPCQTPPAPRRTRFCGLCSQMCLYLSSTRTLTRVSCWCVSVSRFFKEKSQIPAPPPATCLPRENLPFNGETASGPRAAGDKVSPVEFRRLTVFTVTGEAASCLRERERRSLAMVFSIYFKQNQ